MCTQFLGYIKQRGELKKIFFGVVTPIDPQILDI